MTMFFTVRGVAESMLNLRMRVFRLYRLFLIGFYFLPRALQRRNLFEGYFWGRIRRREIRRRPFFFPRTIGSSFLSSEHFTEYFTRTYSTATFELVKGYREGYRDSLFETAQEAVTIACTRVHR